MLAAFAARRFCVQNRLVLTGVQMPPLPLRLMIVQLAFAPAVRTRPTCNLTVLQIHVHFAFVQFQFHPLHKPRFFNSQNLSVQFAILHPAIVASAPLPALPTHYKAGIPVFLRTSTRAVRASDEWRLIQENLKTLAEWQAG